MKALVLYDLMCRALDQADSIPAIVGDGGILDQIGHIKLHARQIRDRELLAKAVAKQLYAERALGEMITAAKLAGHFRKGARRNGSEQELIATLEEVGVDKKLSMRAQQCAKMLLSDFEITVRTTQERIASGSAKILESAPAAHGAGRITNAGDLDFSPTPPWSTRALFELILPALNIHRPATVWEPACGEGHIAEVMGEYCESVEASDIHDYGYAAAVTHDFLSDKSFTPFGGVDWIITNPPFEDRVLKFMLRSLEVASVGVAMFLQLRYLEGGGRYNQVFRDHPPTVVAPFAERVPLLMGEYDPKASTTTAFMWLVWIHGAAPQPVFWIPPGQRERLTRPDDAQRFTQHPVPRRLLPAPPLAEVSDEPQTPEPVWRRNGSAGVAFWTV